MNEKFFPEYKKFIHFLKKEHKGKLDNTNNQIENYIGNSMLRVHKKKFRTIGCVQSNNASKKWMDRKKKSKSNFLAVRILIK